MCIQYTKFFNSTCSLNSIDRSRVSHKLTDTIPGRQTKKPNNKSKVSKQ